jgi:hypothetical protein
MRLARVVGAAVKSEAFALCGLQGDPADRKRLASRYETQALPGEQKGAGEQERLALNFFKRGRVGKRLFSHAPMQNQVLTGPNSPTRPLQATRSALLWLSPEIAGNVVRPKKLAALIHQESERLSVCLAFAWAIPARWACFAASACALGGRSHEGDLLAGIKRGCSEDRTQGRAQFMRYGTDQSFPEAPNARHCEAGDRFRSWLYALNAVMTKPVRMYQASNAGADRNGTGCRPVRVQDMGRRFSGIRMGHQGLRHYEGRRHSRDADCNQDHL